MADYGRLDVHGGDGLGLGEHVDGRDLIRLNGEPEDDADLAAVHPEGAVLTVDEREAGGDSTAEEVLGHRLGTKALSRNAHLLGHTIGSKDDIWGENTEEVLHAAFAGGGEKGGDDFAVGICTWSCLPTLFAHPASGPAGELASGDLGAIDNGGHLVKWHREDIVQHERNPFERTEGVENQAKRFS